MFHPGSMFRAGLVGVIVGLAAPVFAQAADNRNYLGVVLLAPVPALFEPVAQASDDGFNRYYRYGELFDRIEVAVDADGRVIGISARRKLDRIALANDFKQQQVDSLTARFQTGPLQAQPDAYLWRFLSCDACAGAARAGAPCGEGYGTSAVLDTAAVRMAPSHGSFIVTVSFQSRAMADARARSAAAPRSRAQ